MTRMPNITIVLGTARTHRKSEFVASYITEIITATEKASVTFVDVRDHITTHTIPPWQQEGETEKTKQWREIAANTDAFIMVLPEYNHGYPGEWKLLVDQAGAEYRGKPVITAAVSRGPFMGARMAEHVISVYTKLGLVYLPYPLYFGKVEEFVELDQEAKDEQYKDRVLKSFNKLLLFEEHLHGINPLLQE